MSAQSVAIGNEDRLALYSEDTPTMKAVMRAVHRARSEGGLAISSLQQRLTGEVNPSEMRKAIERLWLQERLWCSLEGSKYVIAKEKTE
jgi:hypothetical protein